MTASTITTAGAYCGHSSTHPLPQRAGTWETRPYNNDNIRGGTRAASKQRQDNKRGDNQDRRVMETEQTLSREELQILHKLQARDREVRSHEQAHIAAGGQYVRSGASFQYEIGPDGKRYAVAGEVSIDVSEEKDPRATIRKMNIVRRAALAPVHPSSKDRAVAAQAQIKAARAAAELAEPKDQAGQQDQVTGRNTGLNPTENQSPSQTPDLSALPAGSLVNTYA